jgi:predicted N-acetyltransferase YhbS
VLREYQKTGIGSALVRAGLEAMRSAGVPFVVLVGHLTYYPRFGFERASNHSLGCEYSQAPDDAFMILVLDRQRMPGGKEPSGSLLNSRPA